MSNRSIRRTKIVATIGPATGTLEGVARLIAAGMDCARINMSHGTSDEHRALFGFVREAARNAGRPVSLLADLQGPKLRIASLRQPRTVADHDIITLAGRSDAREGDLQLGFDIDLGQAVRPGGDILIGDGVVRLRVDAVVGRRVRCTVTLGGELVSGKGVALPGARLPFPAITEKDRVDLEVAISEDVDYVALSFVRRAEDVEDLKRLLRRAGSRARVIAKIEKAEALGHLEAIIDVSDGIMVARGDLGVEIGPADVPLTQKRIIRLGRQAGKSVITATQMLESMVLSPEPTRAEASDVANAIIDGTGAVMLSQETAVGRFPEAAVATMARIALAIEPTLDLPTAAPAAGRGGARYVADVIGSAACEVAETLSVAAIVVPTSTGESARVVSKQRPHRPIVAVSEDPGVISQLALDWGVIPLHLPPSEGVEGLWRAATQGVQRAGIAGPGERVVLTAGTLVNRPGSTNTILVLSL